MYISEIKEISNYRNLTGKTIKFNKAINFLIGENNIGKTNVLELLNTFLSVGKFVESDFTNVLEPIKVRLTICYDSDEVGFFEDNFDIDENNAITLIAKQGSVDERIVYYHDTPNETKISATVIKKMNVLYYYAQRMPSKEVDFRKTSGSGKVLNYFIQHSLELSGIEEKDILKKTKLNSIVKDVNNKIDSINTITGDIVNAYLDSNIDKIVCRMLELGDENGREIGALGEGIQYAFNILLQILEIIYTTKVTRKPEDFEERLIDKNGKKIFPLFLILDEPEIHQHPYRQRSLVKKIEALLKNENTIFTSLLKELFDIDGLIGQIFIATHSPNILLNDYRQFIRLYKPVKSSKTSIEIKSGMNIEFNDEKIIKHMLHNFLYLKEAMFSRYIIFVEGDTENGAVPVFAKRMSLDLDEKGIGVIKLDGADSVKRCMKLYEEFGISNVAMIDRDKYSDYGRIKGVYYTDAQDYEEDIYNNFSLEDYVECCKELDGISIFIGILKKKGIAFNPRDFLENYHDVIVTIPKTLQEEIMQDNWDSQTAYLKSSKNTFKGAILAEYVTSIPTSFEKMLNKLIREVK